MQAFLLQRLKKACKKTVWPVAEGTFGAIWLWQHPEKYPSRIRQLTRPDTLLSVIKASNTATFLEPTLRAQMGLLSGLLGPMASPRRELTTGRYDSVVWHSASTEIPKDVSLPRLHQKVRSIDSGRPHTPYSQSHPHCKTFLKELQSWTHRVVNWVQDTNSCHFVKGAL